ncbi:MAG: LytR/AlgR family response regulator transcription factor [Saprospiraceae bacterium]
MTQKQLSILIVEDDLSFAIELEMLVQEVGYQLHGRTDNSAEALEILLSNPPDLVLMDIDIKGRLSGIDVAEKLAHLEIPILFITSYRDREMYDRAQQLGAVGYLVKPINPYTLRTAIQSVVKSLSQQHFGRGEQETYVGNDMLYFKRRNIYEKLEKDKIEYVKANGDYTSVYGGGEEYIASTRLSEFAKLLSTDQFMQIHRSFIVNLKCITSVEASGSHLWINETMLPISRRLKKEVFARINLIK